MRQVRWAGWTVGFAMALALGGVQQAVGDITSDRPAAIVIYPHIESSVGDGIDTIVQLSNTSLTDSILVHCFYENANSHCTDTGEVCQEAIDCCDVGCGVCLPGWNETDFRIRLTPRQPLAWAASQGLTEFPLKTGNSGSRIPPVAEDPFNGALKCIAIDESGTPIDSNVLKGEATLAIADDGGTGPSFVDVAKYNAVGVLAIPGAVNDDRTLVLGGDEAEYNGCPNVLILNHFFDFAANPVNGSQIETRLVLVPCTEDLLRQIPGSAVVQYLVYNEFEQRFSTSRTIDCKQDLYISELDTTQRTRSIFSAGVSGTLTGQTRLTPVEPGSGLLAIADEFHSEFSASFNVHYQGDRGIPDLITLP